MGNIQQKEIDLLELYLRDPALRYNVTECVNETEKSNSSEEQAWARCLGEFVPGALLSRPYLLPWQVQAIWALLFGIMISIAVAGNAIVVWIILAHRRMRTITNLFLLNLAIADFLLASGNAAFNFVFMLESHWPFGEVFCIASNFLANLTVSTSVFTILAMSIDRYSHHLWRRSKTEGIEIMNCRLAQGYACRKRASWLRPKIGVSSLIDENNAKLQINCSQENQVASKAFRGGTRSDSTI